MAPQLGGQEAYARIKQYAQEAIDILSKQSKEGETEEDTKLVTASLEFMQRMVDDDHFCRLAWSTISTLQLHMRRREMQEVMAVLFGPREGNHTEDHMAPNPSKLLN